MTRGRMSPACSKTAVALLCAIGVLVSTSEAFSLIVYEGQVVQSWPDHPGPELSEGSAAFVLGQESYYPAPKGEVWGLTILVEFSDESSAFTVDEIDAWLNQLDYSDGGLNGSIRDYFLSNSNGMLDFRNEIVGFYEAEQPKSYYQGGNGYERASELVAEVIEHFDPTVDFSRFDNDGDGSTEAISIAYAGDGGTFAQGIWPHSGSLGENRDGVRLNRYMMTALEDSLGIYVFAHESGHMIFGWPDLYGFGDYCVMGNATDPRNPAGINDFYRADQGWIPTVVIEPTTNAVYAAQPNAGGYVYLNPADDGEAFFWSNIRNVDRWEVLRGSGLLMFHFDYGIRTNDPPNPLCLAVVQADGLDELGGTTWPSPGSDADDFFHAGSADEISDETSPSTHWNDGSASGLRVYDISESAETMTFTVGTGTPEDLTPIYPDDNSAGASSTGGAGNSGAGGTQTASGGSGDGGSAGENTTTGGNSSTGGAATEGTGGVNASTGGTTSSGSWGALLASVGWG